MGLVVRLNIGSALQPKSEALPLSTKLKDITKNFEANAQVTLNGAPVTKGDLEKTLGELNVTDDSHILYSSKQLSGVEA